VADKVTVTRIVRENIARESRLHTDESRLYGDAPDLFAAHKTVKHSIGEYVRTDFEMVGDELRSEKVHTNSAEGFFSIFKRGMRGIYQHCKEKHLHRYLAEYEFRYNHRVRLGIGDIDRTLAAIRGVEGKRLLYRQPHHDQLSPYFDSSRGQLWGTKLSRRRQPHVHRVTFHIWHYANSPLLGERAGPQDV
jgi:ISXO2-like transposase domain